MMKTIRNKCNFLVYAYEKDIFGKTIDGVELIRKRMNRLLRKHEAAAKPPRICFAKYPIVFAFGEGVRIS